MPTIVLQRPGKPSQANIKIRKPGRTLFRFQLSDPMFRRWTFVIGALIVALILAVVLLFFFHGNTPKVPTSQTNGHMKQMDTMHQQTDK